MRDPEKILVIRFSSIGDIVLTGIVYQRIRERFPQARIFSLVKEEFSDLLRERPDIDEVIVWRKGKKEAAEVRQRLKRINPDLVLDLQNNTRSFLLRCFLAKPSAVYQKDQLRRQLLVRFKIHLPYRRVVERYLDLLRGLGVRETAPGHSFFLPEETMERMRKRLSQAGIGADAVVISKEAAWKTKIWDKYDELIGTLVGMGKQVVLIGKTRDGLEGVDEELRRRVLNLTGELKIMESAAVIGMAGVVVCGDTGIMHLADALGRRLISIWGPTVKGFGFEPFGKNSRVVENQGLKCRPCSLHGSQSCPLRHFKCMKEISVKDILDKIQND